MTSASPIRPPGLHPALSQQQGFALLAEASSARNLLRDCIEAIRGMRYISLQGDAVFTLGSIGVEKAMKIMLGCAEVELVGAWPTQATLRGWGHDLETLDQRLSAALQGGLSKAKSGGYAATLATRIRDSQTLPLIFETFSRYGKSGRFHHLDILATDSPQEDVAPAQYWERVEQRLRDTEPEFNGVPFNDNEAHERYQSRLRRRIAGELETWWFCVHRLGVQGCLGELGTKVGWELWEPGRTGPSIAGI